MNAYERVMAALSGRKSGQVPYAEMFIDPKVIDKIKPGMDYADFIDWADIDIATCLTMAEPAAKMNWIDREKGLWRDKWGAVQINDGDVISTIQGPPVISCLQDLESYEPPDPEKASVLETAAALLERFKGERAVAVVGEAVFAPMQYLRAGFQNFVFDFYDQPELVHAMAEIVSDYHAKLYRILIKMGVDIVFLGDDYSASSGPMVSPEQIREFFLPGLKKVVKAIKDEGGYCIKHTDGDIYKIIPILKEAGVDMLGPLEAPYMNLAEVRDQYDVGVMGNINIDLLARGSREEIVAESRKLLEKTAAGGRFIFSSGNSISSAVTPENFMAMITTVKEFNQSGSF
jgi:uroporphyrinogen decarboxylase